MESTVVLVREMKYWPESQSVPRSCRCFSTELLRPRPIENSESVRGIAVLVYLLSLFNRNEE